VQVPLVRSLHADRGATVVPVSQIQSQAPRSHTRAAAAVSRLPRAQDRRDLAGSVEEALEAIQQHPELQTRAAAAAAVCRRMLAQQEALASSSFPAQQAPAAHEEGGPVKLKRPQPWAPHDLAGQERAASAAQAETERSGG
jgi:hypothetical protein